jgi:hypothetical protein
LASSTSAKVGPEGDKQSKGAIGYFCAAFC